MANRYELPKLAYGYGELAPHISEEQLRLHHEKHHQAYVNGANAIFEKLEKGRKENAELDMKSLLKELSFQVGGHVLHTKFWGNMAPAGKGGGGAPSGALAKAIETEFGSFERFKKEFTQAAVSCEGSGWAVLAYSPMAKHLLIAQIEKHNVNTFIGHKPLLVLDVWEHAYYLDYKNLRAKFVESFWNIVNWKEVEGRFEKE